MIGYFIKTLDGCHVPSAKRGEVGNKVRTRHDFMQVLRYEIQFRDMHAVFSEWYVQVQRISLYEDTKA